MFKIEIGYTNLEVNGKSQEKVEHETIAGPLNFGSLLPNKEFVLDRPRAYSSVSSSIEATRVSPSILELALSIGLTPSLPMVHLEGLVHEGQVMK